MMKNMLLKMCYRSRQNHNWRAPRSTSLIFVLLLWTFIIFQSNKTLHCSLNQPHDFQSVNERESLKISLPTSSLTQIQRDTLMKMESMRIVLLIYETGLKNDKKIVYKMIKNVFSVLYSLRDSTYNIHRIDVDAYIFSVLMSDSLNKTVDFFQSFHWPHGRFQYAHRQNIWGLQQLIDLCNPSVNDYDVFAIFDLQKLLDVHFNWYQYIQSAKKRFVNRQDIIGYGIGGENKKGFISSFEGERDVYMQQSLNSAGIFVPHSSSMWREFLNWLYLNRGDWFLWPTLSGVRNRGDEKWKQFDSTVQGSWQSWLSRFLAIHDMFILHPLEGCFQSLPALKEGEDSRGFKVLKVSINGTMIINEGSSYRFPFHRLRKVVNVATRNNNFVSITLLNKAFLEQARSWMCNVEAGGFRPPGIVWVATDEEAYNELQSIPNSEAIYLENFQGAQRGTAYGNPGYWMLMIERARLMRDILKQGITVFLFETDQVWLRDPMPLIYRILLTGENIDMIGTLDGVRDIAGNFLIFRPTILMRKVYNEVCRLFEKEYIRKNMAKRTSKSVSYMHNDQSILTRLVLYDAYFRSRYPISFRILDTELFTCGKWYDGSNNQYKTNKSKSPTVINNNFVGLNLKKGRLVKFGHWFFFNGSCDNVLVKRAIDENNMRSNFAETYTENAQADDNLIADAINNELETTNNL